jgi:PAS domain S-box-containing protein
MATLEQQLAELQAENAALRARLAGLEAAQHASVPTSFDNTFLRQIIDLIPGLIFVKNREGRFVLVNQGLADVYGKSVADLIGKSDADFNMHADEVVAFRRDDLAVMDSQQPKYIPEEQVNERWYQTVKIPVVDADGTVNMLLGVAVDIHERKLLEIERAEWQQQVIAAQEQALADLSTPVIPLLEHILVMPIIGVVDSERARDIMRSLLKSISDHQARIVILDITGVPLVDSGVAAHLNKTIQAARLKGVTTIITGISEVVAETVVDLGIDWSNIQTERDLEAGLMSALAALNLMIVRDNTAT